MCTEIRALPGIPTLTSSIPAHCTALHSHRLHCVALHLWFLSKTGKMRQWLHSFACKCGILGCERLELQDTKLVVRVVWLFFSSFESETEEVKIPSWKGCWVLSPSGLCWCWHETGGNCDGVSSEGKHVFHFLLNVIWNGPLTGKVITWKRTFSLVSATSDAGVCIIYVATIWCHYIILHYFVLFTLSWHLGSDQIFLILIKNKKSPQSHVRK